jgi:tetratricopeptide (TPR) repeat protein
MAVVYLAEHVVTGARVALKTIDCADASLLSGIRREIHALRRVDHPGVVRIVAEGARGELPWYAMELVEGRPLREHGEDLGTKPDGEWAADTIPLTGRGSQPAVANERRTYQRAANGALPEILKLLRTVCDALAFVHGMGLVHRDLKPENVMVRDDGSTVLVDFGLAMQLRGVRGRDVLEQSDRYIGTPAYMAPEQIDGELMDARVDLYALGCLMYELVTGSPPFVGSIDHVLDQHLRDSPVPPSLRVSDVPRALDELILGLLQKRPRDRIGYADDVAAALSRLGAGDAPPARRAEPHLYRPRLAGRTAALSTVEEKLKNVRVARGDRVLVGGESGVGKTRFAMEVAISANRRGLAVVTGQCTSVAVGDGEVKAASLHPLRHLLSTMVDHCRERGLDETARIFGPRGPALALVEPSIGDLPGQDRYPKVTALPDSAARARLNGCLADTLAAFAEPRPIVLVIEDLQWADEASMSLLRSLDRAYFSAARVLVVGTYRSDEIGPDLRALLGASDVTRVDLGRLDSSAVARMVSDMISMPSPPAAFIQLLVERSDGHPFFVAEYLRMAVRERMLVRNDNGEWQIQRLPGDGRSLREALPLPDELHALLIGRIDMLGPGALAAARIAAVLGREIDADLLAAATKLDDADHLEALEELRAHQIVEIKGRRVRFAHDKLREIIHAQIDEGERRRLHASAGAAIEARYGATPALAGHFSELVHHYTTAHDHEKAFEYLVKAGQAALAASASREALGFFRRAIALDDARPGRGTASLGGLERAALDAQHGSTAFNLGLFPEAEASTGAALHRFLGKPITRRTGALAAVVDLGLQLVPQARLLLDQRPPPAVDPVEQRRLAGAARASDLLAEIHYHKQDWIRAFAASLQTVTLATPLGVSIELAGAYGTLAFSSNSLHLSRLGAIYDARAGDAAKALGDPQVLGRVSMLKGSSEMLAARFGEAHASLSIGLRCAREAEDTRHVEMCLALLAMIESTIGRPDRALGLYQDVGALARKSGSRQTQNWALAGQGLCELALGRAAQAIAVFDERRAVAEDYQRDPVEWINHGIVAEAHLAAGDHASALRAAEATLRQIEKLPLVSFNFFLGYVAT